jgi:hypothetical protein
MNFFFPPKETPRKQYTCEDLNKQLINGYIINIMDHLLIEENVEKHDRYNEEIVAIVNRIDEYEQQGENGLLCVQKDYCDSMNLPPPNPAGYDKYLIDLLKHLCFCPNHKYDTKDPQINELIKLINTNDPLKVFEIAENHEYLDDIKNHLIT